MANKWDGKTKGGLFGYRFFVFLIRISGVRIAYFFCIWVAAYFVLFATAQRNAILHFYRKGFGFSFFKSLRLTILNFFVFGQVLIDRVALNTFRKKMYSHSFENEVALKSIYQMGKGGFLISGHVGNWENAGNLLGERITDEINILMLDDEVEKIKQFLHQQTEKPRFKLIPLKNDMSHLVLIHKALKNNELIALHADRVMDVNDQKTYTFPFLNKIAHFPSGPFIMAHKFKVPVTFVFAVKNTGFHYQLSATNPLINASSPEEIAEQYVKRLEIMVRENPEQWFNYFEYYDN